MLHEPTVIQSPSGGASSGHIVHALMQFLVALRYRKHVVLTSVVVALLIGGLYYTTATRYYGASAKILVMGTNRDGLATTIGTDRSVQQTFMPTFENLLTSLKVVEGALKYLKPEDCVDLAGTPREAWAGILKANLSAHAVFGTNIIELSYLSKDPKAAAAVVQAMVASYQEFLERTHRGEAAKLIDILEKQTVELAEKTEKKQQMLIQARQQLRDIGIRSDSSVVHPLVQRAIYFNEQLIAVQREHYELEATLSAIRQAVARGENLQQHLMSVANVVGKEVLLRSLGFDTRDSYVLMSLERSIVEDQATLETLRQDLGPAHPEVVALVNKVRNAQQYLADYQRRVDARLAEMQSRQLGPLLDRMVSQKLHEVQQLEVSLQVKFEQEQQAAIDFKAKLSRVESIERELERLGKQHEVMLDQIDRLDLHQDGQEVRTAVLRDPVVAGRPVSPNFKRTLLMALAAGLGLGLIVVYVLDILDDRFRSVEELQMQLGAPVLSMVRQLAEGEAAGVEALQVHAAPNAPESEAFRTLRTALALTDREAHQIVISSAEPGDGKTTVLANLAVSYAQSNKRTLLIDGDLRRPGLTALLAMKGVEGLSGVVRGGEDVVQMARRHIRSSGIEGLDVLPSGPRPTNPAELLAHPRFSELLAWAESVYDEVLIDSPPTLATSDTAVIGRLVDGVMMVVQPDKNRRRAVLRALESLTKLKIPVLGIVINRLGSDQDRGYYGYTDGYGYGYAYTAGYGTDEDDLENEYDAEEAEPPADELPAGSAHRRPAGIMPRRVA